MIRGERLDRPTYSVIQTIAEGNTALCYKCRHEIFELDCVQKIVSLLGVPDAVAHREPQLLKELTHPRLVDVWEAQWDPDYDDAVAFTMPYYEGGSLYGAFMAGQVFSLGEAINLVCDVLDALHYLHVEREIVHRDIKPGNVFLSLGCRAAYLGDLGSAAALTEGSAEFAGGSPLYRAPESTKARYTPQSDLYSLGLVLLELVGGRFRYEDIDPTGVTRRLDEGRRTLASRLLRPPVHVPEQMARIINKLLDPDPMRRPKNALEVQRALENVQHANWRQTAFEDPLTWVGEVPSARRDTLPRDIEVKAFVIKRGPDSGKMRLTAQWRQRDANSWRSMKSLERRVEMGDQRSWREFFKSVSTAAFQARARR